MGLNTFLQGSSECLLNFGQRLLDLVLVSVAHSTLFVARAQPRPKICTWLAEKYPLRRRCNAGPKIRHGRHWTVRSNQWMIEKYPLKMRWRSCSGKALCNKSWGCVARSQRAAHRMCKCVHEIP